MPLFYINPHNFYIKRKTLWKHKQYNKKIQKKLVRETKFWNVKRNSQYHNEITLFIKWMHSTHSLFMKMPKVDLFT